jgi:hypothetical protein
LSLLILFERTSRVRGFLDFNKIVSKLISDVDRL